MISEQEYIERLKLLRSKMCEGANYKAGGILNWNTNDVDDWIRDAKSSYEAKQEPRFKHIMFISNEIWKQL